MGAASRSFAAALGVTSLLGVACATFEPGPRGEVESAEYRVGPPDELAVTIRPEPGTERRSVVRPDGRISVELIGDLDVRGKTVAEIRQEIRTRVEEFVVYPDVTVELTQSASRRYYVMGEVERPGAYPLAGDLTVVDGLLPANGPSFLADLNRSRLVRPGAGAFGIRFADITRNGDDATNYPLRPGDVIYVPPNGWGKVGYAIQTALFPLSAIVSIGRQALGYGGI